ncbi:MAG: hypothetical protein WBN65_07225 [Gammaproteobacteria bacterium]
MQKVTSTVIGFLASAVLSMISSGAMAQQDSIRLEHRAQQWELVKDASGQEQRQLVEAARVLPGEEVLFTVTYTNVGAQPAGDVTITNPIPDHMNYLDGSATGDGASITFSVDGGRSFEEPRNLVVTDAEGVQRPATANDYTHIRWILGTDVAAGSSGSVQFTAVVE